jgi:2-dehydro-3-deoxyphosphooctonate aldolase (KDO 8-P synthase)
MNPNTDIHRCLIGPVEIGTGKLALIAGPCMAESLELCLEIATHLKAVCAALDVGFVFKASFDKANRSSLDSYRGPGLEKGLDWLGQVKDQLDVPVITDVHEPAQAAPVAEVADCLQVPAFLCRQTNLLLACGKTGQAVNIKKGQFMAPWDMKHAVDKVNSYINRGVLLTERGTFFGYNRLVNDMRSVPQMQQYAPVVFDATHSTQQPGGLGNASGGEREFAPPLAWAALAMGADALFIETHPHPDKALSDAGSQIKLDEAKKVIQKGLEIYRIIRG